jgi:vacuolar-type H+-ATPase subunit F/Vma7
MSRLFVITRPSLVAGFLLAGVEAFAAEDAEGAQGLIAGWLDDREEGLMAVDENLFEHMDPVFLRRLRAASHLPHLTIPGDGTLGRDTSRRQRIAEMIRRAVGFHITFKGEEAEVKQG